MNKDKFYMIDYQDSYGRTFLIKSIMDQANQVGSIDRILEMKVDVNIQDNDGGTALMYAAGKREAHEDTEDADDDRVRKLIRAKADVNLQDSEGMTALMYASMYVSDPRPVKLLLEAKADTTIVNNEGQTVFDIISRFDSDPEMRNQSIMEKEYLKDLVYKYAVVEVLTSEVKNDITGNITFVFPFPTIEGGHLQLFKLIADNLIYDDNIITNQPIQHNNSLPQPVRPYATYIDPELLEKAMKSRQ